MPTLASLIASYIRTPTATVRLNGQRWYGVLSLSKSESLGADLATGEVIGRAPPVEPAVGMKISWSWGFNGVEVAAFTGEVADVLDSSYPDRWKLQVKDALFRATRSRQVITCSPLNDVTAKAAATYILTTYGGIPASKIALPDLSASGTAWSGSLWKLGILTPIQWGNPDDDSGGTSALQAAQEIYAALGYRVYADASGTVRAAQVERRPSSSPLRTFERGVDLLIQGAPERQSSADGIRNRVIVRGANTGVDGAQIMDAFQTAHPLLPSGVYQQLEYSNFLIEYVNASEAGAASAGSICQRVLALWSRQPDVVRARIKADPRLSVGATVGIKDSGVRLTTAKNYFVYELQTSLDLQAGKFDQQLVLDGGTGSSGYTTIPNPEASFSWRLVAETLDGDAVVEVFLDGSGSTSLSGGEIVSWAWSTTGTVLSGTDDTPSGARAVLLFLASEGSVDVTLTVTDTTSKTGSVTQTIDLTGADTTPPTQRAIAVAFGAAWEITPDGGATWAAETANGDAIAVGIIGAGVDDRSDASAATAYGALATRGTGGTGLRGTLDALATASTNLVAAGGAITSNIWVNEARPARVWFAVGTTVYRSTDGGATKTAMATAPASVAWIMEDPAVDNSVFIAAGANFYVTTDPTVGWSLYYSGPTGATARCFVRSRDGQVTWIGYTGTFTGSPLQRIEGGVSVTFPGDTSEIRALALSHDATSLAGTVYAVDSHDPARLFSADAVTGLSVVESAQTLPAGATAMHMLCDPDHDILYIADFDSVASGTGAVRKWIPQADTLQLFRAGATGRQAHMLGLVGAARTLRGQVLLLPYGESGAADKLFILDLTTRAWTSKALPEAGRDDWYEVKACPFDPDQLLLLRRDPVTDDDNRLWYSSDFGSTWVSVFQNVAHNAGFNAMPSVQWSPTFGGQWVVVTSNAVLLGDGGTYTSHAITSAGTLFSGGAGTVGDALLLGIGDQFYYLTSGTETTGADAVAAGVPYGYPYLLATGYRAAWARESDESEIRIVADYRTGAWANIAGAHARRTLAYLADGTIVGHKDDAVETVADPLGAATVTSAQIAGAGTSITAVVGDQQTRTLAAAIAAGAYDAAAAASAVYARDAGGGWTRFERPSDAGDLTNAIEAIVRAT